MSYKLQKPFTEEQKIRFIVEYNHKLGLRIVDTNTALYALEINEIMENGVPVINTEYENEIIESKKQQFYNDFFATSLGYIRRKVTMKTGETKDFLSDLLPVIYLGATSGQPVNIITYKEPDFTQEYVNWEELQEHKVVTPEFLQECFAKLSTDFTG